MRRYVECRVLDANAVGGDLLTGKVRYFARRRLLDGNGVAVRCREVNRGPGSGNKKGNSMLLREYRNGISPDFVRHIAIGGDTIGTHDNCSDLALLHHDSGHVVGDYRCGNS